MQKRALILGIGGQDGSYLAEHLWLQGYEVHGLHRRSSVDNLARVSHLLPRIRIHRGDLGDPVSLEAVIAAVEPQEVYNFADQDHVAWSYETPLYSHQVTAGSVVTLLELAKLRQFRLLQPISATVFGATPPPHSIASRRCPMSPYACAKDYAWNLCRYYRRCYPVWVACAVLFNHDSPRRNGDYLLHKIAMAAKSGDFDAGKADFKVNVGFAGDYVVTMHAMLQRATPDDFCIGAEESPTVVEWCHLAGFEPKRGSKTSPRPGPVQELIPCDHEARMVLGHRNTFTPRVLMDALVRKYHG